MPCGPIADSAPSVVNEVVNSPGSPLDSRTQQFFEPRFGYDFSKVRVHTDQKAAQSANDVSADAYTLGNHIVFAPGQYDPGSKQGKHTVAHELAHAVQQSSSPLSPLTKTQVKIGPPGDASERAADKVADAVVSSDSPAPHQAHAASRPDSTAPVLQRQPQRNPQRQQRGTTTTAQAASSQTPTGNNQTLDASEVWERVEGRVISELEIKFVEIGRVAGLQSKRQIRELFQPYEDDLKATRTFLDIAGILTAGAGNVPQDPSSWQRQPGAPAGTPQGPLTPTASVTGFLGGAFAQVANVVMSNLLNTDRVGDVKENANIEIDEMLARVLTTDSPIFEQFQGPAVRTLAGEFYDWWNQDPHKDHISARIAEYMFPGEARTKFAVGSPDARHILDYVHDIVEDRLEPVKTELDKLSSTHRSRRLWAGATGGAIAGSIIGGAIGLGVGGGTGALIGLGVGALAGGGIGLLGGAITNWTSKSASARRRQARREE